MRNLVVLEFITLDGVMQAPGGPEEDPSGDFKFGGWTVPFFDETSGEVMSEQMGRPFDLLLGRKTYDIFAAYWPKQEGETAEVLNKATKYVVSHKNIALPWDKSVLISGDVVSQIKDLKRQDGPMLQVYGSGNLCQTLLRNDLADELWLKTFPVTLGTGKHLFGEGTIPTSFALADSKVSPSGVIFASYKRAGEVKTGSFD
jgi:dihydrofolate reductase